MPSMKIQVTILVDVVPCEDGRAFAKTAVVASVRQAIANAVDAGEQNGFSHNLENDIALTVDAVSAEAVS